MRGGWCRGGALAAALVAIPPGVQAQGTAADCAAAASDACYFAFTPPGAAGRLHYYASRSPDGSESPGSPSQQPAPTTALIVLHGHSRDANKTFDAALAAVQRAGVHAATLVVAPLFQVDPGADRKCHTAGVPSARAGDLRWTCASWIAGGPATGDADIGTGAAGGPTSFAVLDALVAELLRRWPSLRVVTIAGFSAGAQMVQHYIGFAAVPAAGGPTVRYVVADPGSWLYFDALRPQPVRDGVAVGWSVCAADPAAAGQCSVVWNEVPAGTCAKANRWKYGTADVPAALGRSAADARARYAAADISYLEGERDSASGPGTAARVLDTSCAANAQGPYRLQRGLAYRQYERTVLMPSGPRTFAVVPGCAHDVACVFPSATAQAALIGPAR